MRKNDKSIQVETALHAKDIQMLGDKIDGITKAMTDGFAGVHARQDKTNGNVIHAQDDITALKSKFEYNRIIWYMLTVSVSVIITLASYIIFKSP